jgi:hypothetical protein
VRAIAGRSLRHTRSELRVGCRRCAAIIATAQDCHEVVPITQARAAVGRRRREEVRQADAELEPEHEVANSAAASCGID